MASAFGHAAAAWTISRISHIWRARSVSRAQPDQSKLTWLAIASSILPDADSIGFKLGVPYGSWLGVGFFIPFEGSRYFFPFRPIEVSPISVLGFFSEATRVLGSELVWIGGPCAAALAIACIARRLSGRLARAPVRRIP